MRPSQQINQQFGLYLTALNNALELVHGGQLSQDGLQQFNQYQTFLTADNASRSLLDQRQKAGLEEVLRYQPKVATSVLEGCEYILMPQTDTYALGVHALQEKCLAENNPHQPKFKLSDGREVYRPNTFLENIVAKIIDFETLTNSDGSDRSPEERKRFFITWNDSCCGVAYQAQTTKLKLSLQCPELIGIAKDFNAGFLPVNYANFQGDFVLDSSKPTFVHDGWLALLEDRKDVYNNYLTILKSIIGNELIPNFRVRQNTENDELRAVFVYGLYGNSFASGINYLNGSGRSLLRVALLSGAKK